MNSQEPIHTPFAWARGHHFKAVIFDLDGTLVDSMWIWRHIDEAYLVKHGYHLPEDLQKAIEGMSTTETAQYFKDRFGIADSIDAIKEEWIGMARDYYATKIPLKPGADLLLDSLRDKGVKVGIGTSNFRDLADLVLDRHGIRHHLESLRTSCEVERGKPHPDVFLKVASDLGVDPKACLVFEDTHAGVLAAKAAGMACIIVEDPLSKPFLEEMRGDAQGVIEDFTALLDHIKSAPVFGAFVIE